MKAYITVSEVISSLLNVTSNYTMPGQLILGSDFVRRLEDHIQCDMHLPGTTYFCGIDGLRTDKLPSDLLDTCTALNPDVVFIHVGENDITVDSSPREIFPRLLSMVEVFYNAGCNLAVILP